MKKAKYFIYSLILFVVGLNVCFAASLSVSTNKKNVTVGNTFTVTVNASGASGWEYCLNYDSSMFSLVSATSDTGGACVRTGSTLIGYSKVTFTLKSTKSGTSVISLRDAVMYGDDGNEISSSKGSVSITAKTQQEIEASYSSNADLKNLTIEGYELSPEFNKDTLEYSLEVENDVESVRVSVVKADGNASVSGAGEISLSEGINKVEIVVTAQKGNKKTYKINITRKELNPIVVNVGGESFNVVRKSDSLEAPMYYSATTITIDDLEVPAFESEITGFTLVGLKNEDGDINLYRYENGEYILYNQIAKDGFVFIPLSNEKTIKEYSNKKEIKINNTNVFVYSDKEEETEFVLIYGMNASNGDENWYKYDTKEGTFQRYVEEANSGFSKDEYFYITVAFAIGLGLSIVIIILLLVMNSVKDKKNKKLISLIEKKIKVNNQSNVLNEDLEDEELSETQKIEKLNNQFLDFIDQNANEERKDKITDIESKEKNFDESELSKREIRKLEKEKQKEEEAELLAMQEDFLETKENDILSDTDIIEEIQEKSKDDEGIQVEVTSKSKKKKKKNNKK